MLEQPGKQITGYEDILTARESARIFTKRGAPAKAMLFVADKLQASGAIGIKTVTGLLGIFPEIEPAGRVIVLHIASAFLLASVVNPEITPDVPLMQGVAMLLNNINTDLRTRALKVLLALREKAAPVQDYALGCIRNADAQIRLGGAQLLRNLGTNCSRSIVKQIRQAVEKYPTDTEYCRLLQETEVLLA